MTKPSSLTEGDVWVLHIGVILYGYYSLSCTNVPLVKLVKSKKITWGQMFKSQRKFYLLKFIGSWAVVLFPMYDALKNRHAFFSSTSFFIGLFCAMESYICCCNTPFTILSTAQRKILKTALYFHISISVIRAVVDIIAFVLCYTGQNDDFYKFAFSFRMACAAVFAISQFISYRIANSFNTTPDSTSPDTASLLQANKSILVALASANVIGTFVGIADVVNAYLELQVAQGALLLVGCSSLIYYGVLLRIGLGEDQQPLGMSSTTIGVASLSSSNGVA